MRLVETIWHFDEGLCFLGKAFREVFQDWPDGSGKTMALKALSGSDTATIITIQEDGATVGVANYRVSDEGIKRICMGSKYPRQGFGSMMVRIMIRENPNLPMWCTSVPEANGWCEAIGMTPGEVLEKGWRIYRWTAEEAAAFEVEV